MSASKAFSDIQKKLSVAIDSGDLPVKISAQAERLGQRLSRPVRISLAGMPGAGKSTMLNLLVGSKVIPEDVRLPTLQLSFGKTAKSVCTMADGSTQRLDGVNPAKIADLQPIFVQLELPLPALKRISVLEIVAGENPNQQTRALNWAFKRTDITLWCTRAFTGAEQALWKNVPDHIKDHAFLLLTHADVLAAAGTLKAELTELKENSGDDFSQILPVATINGIAARRADGAVDKEKMRNSGGLALISAILRQVDMGLQSVVDQAEILLSRYAPQSPEPTAQDITPEPEQAKVPVPEPAKPTSRADDQDTSEPETTAPGPEPKSDVTEPADEDPESAEEEMSQPPVEAAEEAAPKAQLSPETREAYEYAVDYLSEQGRKMTTADEISQDDTMPDLVESVSWLSDYLEENGDDHDPSLQLMRDTALDAVDLIQLMQMEKTGNAPVEAVSLVIQLKRELRGLLAA